MLWSGLRKIYQWELKFYKADQNKRCFKQKITNNKHTNVAKQNFWKLVANECNWEKGPLLSYLLGLSQRVNCSTYSWWFRNPASTSWDGKYPINYDGFQKHPNGSKRWFFEISEPSTAGYCWFLFLVTRTYSFSNPVPITDNRHLHNWYIQGGRGGLETTKMCR